jgi:hypothetical protein
MSPRGCEQQINTFPSAAQEAREIVDLSAYQSTLAAMAHPPFGGYHLTGASHVSASSSRLCRSGRHATADLLGVHER